MSKAAAAPDPLAVRLLYSPHRPSVRQHAFLLLDDLGTLEALYGGAAGGGKSDALLMAALRYVDVPGYSALLLRRTFADLNLPGALMDRSRTWLAGTDAKWNERDTRWTFPSGAKISFGYLQTGADRYRYASAEFQFIGFDELTLFPELDYRFLFTRLRRPSDSDNPLSQVPLRMRAATNPGGQGHQWVKRRFIDRAPDPDDPADTPEKCRARIFVPAKLDDNPHVDADGYRRALAEVDPQVRKMLEDGDWNAREPGEWVYDSAEIDAAEALGHELDQQLRAGTLPPPAGGELYAGIDWGEHTHCLICWPLPGGGVYVAREAAIESTEVTDATRRMFGGPDDDGKWEDGILQAVTLAGLPAVEDAIEYLRDIRYDAAGIAQTRTMLKPLRARKPKLRTVAVAFGGAAAKSGGSAAGAARSFKAETLSHIRLMLRRTHKGHDLGVIAISPQGCPILLEQMRALKWRDSHAGTIDKGNDHGADALIAAVSTLAIAARSRRKR